MSAKATDGRLIDPEVFDDIEVLLVSGQRPLFSRLYLFEKASFLQLYRFGEPWPHLLPWPAPRQHRRIVGYLQAAPSSVSFALQFDIARITARRGQVSKEISDIAVVRIEQDSKGRLYVKFRAAQSQQSISKEEPGTQNEDVCEFRRPITHPRQTGQVRSGQ